MPKAINLGHETESFGAVAPANPAEKHTYYPSLYISDCPELMGLEDGEAVIKFRVAGHSESTNRDGKESCSMELEVLSILPKKMPAPEADGESDTEAAFSEYESKK